MISKIILIFFDIFTIFYINCNLWRTIMFIIIVYIIYLNYRIRIYILKNKFRYFISIVVCYFNLIEKKKVSSFICKFPFILIIIIFFGFFIFFLYVIFIEWRLFNFFISFMACFHTFKITCKFFYLLFQHTFHVFVEVFLKLWPKPFFRMIYLKCFSIKIILNY